MTNRLDLENEMSTTTATTKSKREQIESQYRAVAHMASAIAALHTELLTALPVYPDDMLDFIGARSADYMDTLGSILNAMDAHDPEADAWLDPVFEQAYQMWPDADVQAAGSPAADPHDGHTRSDSSSPERA